VSQGNSSNVLLGFATARRVEGLTLDPLNPNRQTDGD